jgi:hypothetical protein
MASYDALHLDQDEHVILEIQKQMHIEEHF